MTLAIQPRLFELWITQTFLSAKELGHIVREIPPPILHSENLMASFPVVNLALNANDRGRSSDKFSSRVQGRNFKFVIIAVVVLFPIVVLFAFYSSLNVVATNAPFFHFLNSGSSNGIATNSENITSIGNLNATAIQSSFQSPNFLPNISVPSEYLIVLIVLIFFLVSAVVVMDFRRQQNVIGCGGTATLEEQRVEVANLLDNAVSELRGGSEYRRTVLECYRKISELLEAKNLL